MKKPRDPQRHPHANIILICLGCGIALGIAGAQIGANKGSGVLAFFLGLGAGVAFTSAQFLLARAPGRRR